MNSMNMKLEISWKVHMSQFEPYELCGPGFLEALSKVKHKISISVGTDNTVEPPLHSALNTTC